MLRIILNLAIFAASFALGTLLSAGVPGPVTRLNERAASRIAPVEHYNFFAGNKPAAPSPLSPAEPHLDPAEVARTFCSDRAVRPIWKLIRQDPVYRELLGFAWTRFDSPDCKDMLEVKHIDLNGDGRKEILVRGTNMQLCGGVGNCAFWILKRERKRLRILLAARDYWDADPRMGKQVRTSRTNGYADILLKGHFSAAETSYTTYKYDGEKYIEKRCLYHVPDHYTDKNTRWRFVSCKEFYRGLNL